MSFDGYQFLANLPRSEKRKLSLYKNHPNDWGMSYEGGAVFWNSDDKVLMSDDSKMLEKIRKELDGETRVFYSGTPVKMVESDSLAAYLACFETANELGIYVFFSGDYPDPERNLEDGEIM